MNFARQALMAQRNPAVRAAERRALARLLQGGRRYASMAARRVRGFAARNPQTTAFGAGAAAQVAYAARKGSKRKRMKTGIAKGRKIPRRAGKPPATPSSRVSAKYAVADRMTKFRKTKVTKQKLPKSAIAHYKECGMFSSKKCMYINHEHWGSIGKVWYGIGLGLAKKLLPMAKIYHGKSLEDPCIGPRTALDPLFQRDSRTTGMILQLIFIKEVDNADTERSVQNIALETSGTSGGATVNVYRPMHDIAKDIATQLSAAYSSEQKMWLAEAVFLITADNANDQLQAQPIYIQNLDDAEIHLYVNSLVRFQNVTLSDGLTGDVGSAGSADKMAIDANPLVGRVFTARGNTAQIDSDLAQCGNKTLDRFFGQVGDSGTHSYDGLTLLGYHNTTNVDDLGRISHIPQARELYGNQTVKQGNIHMAPGGMKYHKTTFTIKKTFRALATSPLTQYTSSNTAYTQTNMFGSHTLFGFKCEHKHGNDEIKLGYNRDTDVGCYIAHKTIVHPLKTNYTHDSGLTTTTTVPTEHNQAS